MVPAVGKVSVLGQDLPRRNRLRCPWAPLPPGKVPGLFGDLPQVALGQPGPRNGRVRPCGRTDIIFRAAARKTNFRSALHNATAPHLPEPRRRGWGRSRRPQWGRSRFWGRTFPAETVSGAPGRPFPRGRSPHYLETFPKPGPVDWRQETGGRCAPKNVLITPITLTGGPDIGHFRCDPRF